MTTAVKITNTDSHHKLRVEAVEGPNYTFSVIRILAPGESWEGHVWSIRALRISDEAVYTPYSDHTHPRTP